MIDPGCSIETSEPRTNDCPFFSEIDNFVQRKTTFFFPVSSIFEPYGGLHATLKMITGRWRCRGKLPHQRLREDRPWHERHFFVTLRNHLKFLTRWLSLNWVCVCVSWRLTGRTDVITSGDIIMLVIIAERGIISRFAAGWNWYSPGVGASKLKDIRIISCVIRIKGKNWTEIKVAIFDSVPNNFLEKIVRIAPKT